MDQDVLNLLLGAIRQITNFNVGNIEAVPTMILPDLDELDNQINS